MGGIESFMAELMKQQVEDGCQVSAIVHHHDVKQPTVYEENNGSTICRVKSYGAVAYAPMAPDFYRQLIKLARQKKPDIIHIHMPNLSAFWCLFLPQLRKIPWVVHWHADVIGSAPDLKIKLLYPFYRVFEKALLTKAQAVIATSPNYLLSSEPLQEFIDKTKVIPLGLSGLSPKLPMIRDEDKGALKLLIVGRLTYYKGHKILIDAIKQLVAAGVGVNLKIVGDGELRQVIDTQVKSYQLQENIHMLGKVSEKQLEQEMCEADLLCLPSIERTEAFGVVLLEAASVSTPSLVTSVKGSGMSYVVQDKLTGIVTEANSTDSLRKSLLWAAQNKELLRELGQSAKRRFDNCFSIVATSSQISELYKQVFK